MPVCFATDRNEVVVPVDLIKPKSSAVLRRTRNLDADPRAVLLCDHWDPVDWSQLWWIRASMTRIVPDAGRTSELGQLLADKYSQYEQQPFADLIVLTVNELTGWSGENERPD